MSRHRVIGLGTAVALVVVSLTALGVTGPAAASQWMPERTLSDAGQNAYGQQVAVDGQGNVVAVWLESDGSNHRVRAARMSAGGAWSTPVILSGPGHDAYDPQVAVDGRGDAVAVWTRLDGSPGSPSRVQAVHRPAGGTWGAPVTLSNLDTYTYAPQVAVDDRGSAVVVWGWSDTTGTEGVRAASRPADGAWSTPVTLSGDHAVHPRVAVDGQGNAVAVWTRYDGSNDRVQTARRPAGGAWRTPVTLSAPGQDAWSPEVAVDGRGSAVAVWLRSDGSNDRVQTADRPAAGAWSTPVILSEPGRSAYGPQVATGGQGNTVAVWLVSNGYQVNKVQAADRPAAGAWSTPVDLSGSNLAIEPQVAVGAHGDAVAAWANSDGANWRVRTAQLPAGGVWIWHGDLSVSGQDAHQPQLAVDGQGNAVAAWYRSNGSINQVQAGGLDAAGPVSRMTQPSLARQTVTRISVSWSASDAWSSVASHDVRYRVARYDGGFDPWAIWQADTVALSATFLGEPGRTYCFSARARDTLNNLGAWSTERCTATPVDDRALTSLGGWTRRTGNGRYLRTYTVSSRQGATLRLAGVKAKHLALLVTRIPGGGKVAVSLSGTTLGTFSLASPTVADKALIRVKTFPSVRTGVLRIRIVSPTGKPVLIDGVVVSRR